MFATGTADRKFCIFEKNRHCARNTAHPTSENGKLAALTSGRPAFQQHTKRTEGSDTTHASHTQKALSAGCTNRNFGRSEKDHAAQRGRDACGTATRISASLSRRLSAFVESAPGPDPKAAKFAVLPPGHAGFPQRVKQSEGSNSAPIRNTPVSPCVPLCAIFLRKPSVYPLSPVKANVSRLCEKLKNWMRNGWGQRCGGNFLAIFAGTLLDEKPNFLSRIFGRGRPFDFSTDRLCICQAEISLGIHGT